MSRQFHRITIPHLYRSLVIKVGDHSDTLHVDVHRPGGPECYEFDLPTTCNAFKYLDTAKRRPEYVQHTNFLQLQRLDLGYHERRVFGLYGYENKSPSNLTLEDLRLAMLTEDPLDESRISATMPCQPTQAGDEFHGIATRVLRVLPNLQVLD